MHIPEFSSTNLYKVHGIILQIKKQIISDPQAFKSSLSHPPKPFNFFPLFLLRAEVGVGVIFGYEHMIWKQTAWAEILHYLLKLYILGQIT